MFGVTAVLGGIALAHLRHLRFPRLNLDWVIQVLFNLTLGLLLLSTVFAFLRLHPMPVVAGLESPQEYLERRLGEHALVMAEMEQLPAEAVVLFLWEPRSFYCPVDCRPDALLDRWLHHTHYQAQDAADIARQWRTDGVTHVLLHQRGLDIIVDAAFDPVREPDLAALQTMQTEHLREIQRWGDPPAYLLYELRN
jgi:hypothetical protein